MSSDIKNDLKTFITSKFIVPVEITDDLSLTESGVIDSMGVISLISYIENNYNIEVDDEEIMQKNFGSINKITAFITSKLS